MLGWGISFWAGVNCAPMADPNGDPNDVAFKASAIAVLRS
jgi:hypothetical protein